MHAIRSIFRSLAAKSRSLEVTSDDHSLAVWVIVFGAIVVALVALPSNKQVAYGLIGDKNYAAARAQLIDLHTNGEGDLHSAIALHNVHLRFGELDQADSTMRDALERYPANIDLLTRAVEFYRDVQQPTKRLRLLMRMLELKPSSKILDEVLQLLRLHNRDGTAKKVLLNLADSSILKAEHHAGLGHLLAQAQKYDQAVSHFLRADTLSSTVNWKVRIALFRLLLLRQHFVQSEALAKQWLSHRISRDQLAFLYDEQVDANRPRSAETFLKEAVLRKHISQQDAVRMQQESAVREHDNSARD